jgi:hypothetical protein
MADLLDIAASTAVHAVWIRGERTVVRGLNANDIAFIVSRFPHIGKLVSGEFSESMIAMLIERLGAAVGPVIAAGCGHLGDEKYEHAAGTILGLEEQVTLFEPIWKLTFPNGTGSFVAKMTRLFGGAGEGAKNVKVRLKKSPSPSQPSSDAGSRPTMQ